MTEARFNRYLRLRHGFTLVEIVIVVLALGALATVAIPKLGNMIYDSKKSATREEMRILKLAIIGSSDSKIRGYENDVGSVPPDLTALVTKPSGVADWNRFNRIGWNGPYISTDQNEYLKDAWGDDYIYDPVQRYIKSMGSGDTLTVNF
jgi:prepilin-type N-terminal cleavage/methylation domain-containing protein